MPAHKKPYLCFKFSDYNFVHTSRLPHVCYMFLPSLLNKLTLADFNAIKTWSPTACFWPSSSYFLPLYTSSYATSSSNYMNVYWSKHIYCYLLEREQNYLSSTPCNKSDRPISTYIHGITANLISVFEWEVRSHIHMHLCAN
jgi:hypothetical protein